MRRLECGRGEVIGETFVIVATDDHYALTAVARERRNAAAEDIALRGTPARKMILTSTFTWSNWNRDQGRKGRSSSTNVDTYLDGLGDSRQG